MLKLAVKTTMSWVFWHLYHAITGKGKSVYNTELMKETTSNLCLSMFVCFFNVNALPKDCRHQWAPPKNDKKERRSRRTALQPRPTRIHQAGFCVLSGTKLLSPRKLGSRDNGPLLMGQKPRKDYGYQRTVFGQTLKNNTFYNASRNTLKRFEICRITNKIGCSEVIKLNM